ncbi:MAG TPA: sigma-70 family RNA polymerase sigma factor, partial [Planctomycetota bacterium]|nr:sigma-70 family RNA polymerase sigma factor [Planctomycetota bacterium]
MIRPDLLREYFRSPSPGALITLLNACTDPVYSLCVQVLRNRQDAEDAAQTVLMKILDQVMATPEIRDFDRWLYRVALNTALTARLQRERRLSRDLRRTPMPEDDCIPDDVRKAVYEAIAELDDDARCLVVQHFMEGRTLEELGRERGCSAVAIWKRIDRAKGRLREALEKVGPSDLLSGFDAVLGSNRLVQAPSTLSDAVAAKAGALAAGTKSGATLALGGLAMSAKGVPVALAAALAIALFVVGVGGSYGFPFSDPAKKVASALVPGSANRSILAAAPARAGAAEEIAAPSSGPFASAREPMDADALAAELQKVGALLREAHTLVEKDGVGAPELYKRVNRLWQEIREPAFRDVSVLFAFLREPVNGGIVEDLVELVLSYELRSNGAFVREADELPKAVIAGLAQMIADGTKLQKLAVLSRLPYLGGGSQMVLANACIDLLGSETDSELLSTILSQFHAQDAQFCSKLEDRLDLVRNIWQ